MPMEGQKENYFQFQFLEGEIGGAIVSRSRQKLEKHHWNFGDTSIGKLPISVRNACDEKEFNFGYLFTLDSLVEETYNPMLA